MDAQAITQRLEAVFGAIQRDRMTGVPIVNPRLAVAATGTQRLGNDWFSVLVTPWCMNIMLLPGDESWTDWRLGAAVQRNLPAGTFGFIGGEEPALGRYLMCSLFSPMQEFADQAAALATAAAAAKELLASAPAAMQEAPRSRRALFGLPGEIPGEAQS